MPTATTSLTLRKILPCSAERAFGAWTQPAQVQKWFLPHPDGKVVATFDLRVGGSYRIEFHHPSMPTWSHGGKFRVVDAPRRLEYTWNAVRFEAKSDGDTVPDTLAQTVVKVSFNALTPDQTEIVLTHERFADASQCADHMKGWATILGRVAEAMASA